MSEYKAEQKEATGGGETKWSKLGVGEEKAFPKGMGAADFTLFRN